MTAISVESLRVVQPLRDLQRLNAAFSALTAVAIAAASGWLSHELDAPRFVVVVVGVGLIGWAALLVVLAVQPARRLVRMSALVAAGDAAWVIGSVVLIVMGDVTGAGAVLVAVAAVLVAGFAIAGIVLGRRARLQPVDGRTELLFGRVVVATPPGAAWQMVLDADLYARLAPNLTRVSVAPDECARTCTDTGGNTWTETMHLDHDRHVQRIDVDVAEHPMPLDTLAATVSVHDVPAGSRIDLAFAYVPRLTVQGLATSLVLPLLGRRLLRPILRGWASHATTHAAEASGVGR